MATGTKYIIIPAKEAKNHFGELLDTAQRRPVIITKKGRPVAKMIAFVNRERFEEVENKIWLEKTLKVMKNPQFIGPKKSAQLLAKYRNA